MSTKAGFVLPGRLWCTILLGQVSADERSSGKFELPKNDIERDAFKYETFEAQVRKLAPGTLKVFKAQHVQKYTTTLLVHPGDNDTRRVREVLKYCKFCKLKHAPGKHNARGQEALEPANAAKNNKKDELRSTRNRTRRGEEASTKKG